MFESPQSRFVLCAGLVLVVLASLSELAALAGAIWYG